MKRYTNYIVSMSLMVPSIASAVALGDLTVKSYLNQPLNAYIRITSLQGAAFAGIKVRLASPEAFKRAGVPRPYSLSKLSFKLEHLRGKPVVHVTSMERIDEPYVRFLLDVTWASGQYYRAYTVLLDPPGYSVALKAQSKSKARMHYQPRGVKHYEEHQPLLNAKVTKKEETVKKDNTTVTPPVVQTRTYGPTVKTDDLWQIAKRFTPRNANIDQTMLAILKANPKAFLHENVNGLKLGVKLTIPSDEAIASVPAKKAIAEVEAHITAWKSKKPIKHVLPISEINLSSRQQSRDTSKNNQQADTKLSDDGSYRPPFSIKKVDSKKDTFTPKLIPESNNDETEKHSSQASSDVQKTPENASQTKKKEPLFDDFIPVPKVLSKIVKHPKASDLEKTEPKESLKLQAPKDDKASEAGKDKTPDKNVSETSSQTQQSMNSSELAVATSAIKTVKESNKLLREEVKTLLAQNELLKKRAMSSEKTMAEMRSQLAILTKALNKYYVINDKGEFVKRDAVGSEGEGAKAGFTLTEVFLIMVILLALVAGCGLALLYSWQQKQKQIASDLNTDDDVNEEVSEDQADDTLKVKSEVKESKPKAAIISPNEAVIEASEPAKDESKKDDAQPSQIESKKDDLPVSKKAPEPKVDIDKTVKKDSAKSFDTPKEDKPTPSPDITPQKSADEKPKEKPKEEPSAKTETIKPAEMPGLNATDAPPVAKDVKKAEVAPFKEPEKVDKTGGMDNKAPLAEQKPKATSKKATRKDLEKETAAKSTSLLQSVLSSGQDEQKADDNVADIKPQRDNTAELVDQVETSEPEAKEDDKGGDNAMDFDAEGLASRESKKLEEPAAPSEEDKGDDNALDFDAEGLASRESDKAKEPDSKAPPAKEGADDDDNPFVLDFETGLADKDEGEPAESAKTSEDETKATKDSDDKDDGFVYELSMEDDKGESDEADDALNAPISDKVEEQGEGDGTASKGANVSTQLALAETYIAMEDYESAAEALNEVIASNSTEKQKEQAKKLLDSIKGQH